MIHFECEDCEFHCCGVGVSGYAKLCDRHAALLIRPLKAEEE